jgi:signal transduction histidine kinase
MKTFPFFASLLVFFLVVIHPVHSQNDPSDSLKKVLKTAEDDDARFDAVLELFKLNLTGDSALSAKYEKQARKLAGKRGDELSEARLKRLIALKYFYAREYPKFDSITTSIMNVFKEHGEKELYGHCLNNLGSSHFYLGKLPEAEKYHREALKYYEPDEQLYLQTSLNIAINLYQQGRYSEALKRLLPLSEKFRAKGDDFFYANCLVMIANIYNRQGDNEKAKKYNTLYIEKADEIGHKEGVAGGNLNLAQLYHQEEDYQNALEHVMVAKKIFESIDKYYQLANTLITTGRIYKEMGKYSKSWDLYDQAMQLSKKYGFQNRISNIYQKQSDLLLLEENYSKAEEKAFKAYQMGKEVGKFNRVSDAAFNLYEASKALGKTNKALHYHEEYARYKDSIQKEQNSQQVQALKANFEIRQKEYENKELEHQNKLSQLEIKQQKSKTFIIGIILFFAILIGLVLFLLNRKLKNKNRTISRQKEELGKANSMKDNMFSIIAHDLRGPVGNLNSLLEFLDYESAKDKEDYDHTLKMVQDSASSTYTLLENLLTWARQQKNEIIFNPDYQNINTLVEKVVFLKEPAAQNKKIKLIHNIEGELSARFDYEMIHLVMRNLVDNAIKFTPEEGEVKIEADMKEDKLEIAVSDSGMGIKEEVKEKLFDKYKLHTTRGTKNEKGSGLGLKLCHEFVTKHAGELKIESKEGEGSTFVFSIPAN